MRSRSVARSVITPFHEQLLTLFKRCPLADRFYLAGGTALAAAYLHHRVSEDLDFFTGDDAIVRPAAESFQQILAENGIPVRVDLVVVTFCRLLVGSDPAVKVELAHDSPYRLAPLSQRLHGVWVNSLEDLAADKTCALFDRFASRDFVDVYFLAQHCGKRQLMAWAKAKNPGFDTYWFARALGNVDHFNPTEVTLLVPLDVEEMKSFFRKWAVECLHAISNGGKPAQ